MVGKGIEGSFENPIEIKQLLDLAPIEYKKFVKINGRVALFDEPQIIDWSDETLKTLGAYFLIEIGENVFYQKAYLLSKGLTPVKTRTIEENTQPFYYTQFLNLIERAKIKNA